MGLMRMKLHGEGLNIEVRRLTYPTNNKSYNELVELAKSYDRIVIYGRGMDKIPSKLATLEPKPVSVNRHSIYFIKPEDWSQLEEFKSDFNGDEFIDMSKFKIERYRMQGGNIS